MTSTPSRHAATRSAVRTRHAARAVAGALTAGLLLSGCGGISIGIGPQSGSESPDEQSTSPAASAPVSPSDTSAPEPSASTPASTDAASSPTEGPDTTTPGEPSDSTSPATDATGGPSAGTGSTDSTSPGSDPFPTTDPTDAGTDPTGGPVVTDPSMPTDSASTAGPSDSSWPSDPSSPGATDSGWPSESSASADPGSPGSTDPGSSGDQPADALGRVVEDPGIPHRGEAFRWASGLVAHVSTGDSFVPSPAAAGTEGFSQFLRFDVTLTNRAPESFRLSDFRIGAQSAGEQGSRVFDSGNGVNSLPAQDLGMGETTTFPVVFGVRDPDDTVLDVVQAFELSDRVVFLPPAD